MSLVVCQRSFPNFTESVTPTTLFSLLRHDYKMRLAWSAQNNVSGRNSSRYSAPLQSIYHLHIPNLSKNSLTRERKGIARPSQQPTPLASVGLTPPGNTPLRAGAVRSMCFLCLLAQQTFITRPNVAQKVWSCLEIYSVCMRYSLVHTLFSIDCMGVTLERCVFLPRKQLRRTVSGNLLKCGVKRGNSLIMTQSVSEDAMIFYVGPFPWNIQ
ncbi:hypothetical protein C8F04DRAFT_315938 [Mycena alexandri]|uniref:Uncharacterized protein n=1 Tax=Mycena alexandri TaxID=1745969 RepID=A0AAD6T4G4_9AGAR|nr:hypothetical protein C8F04DRAFT_315938 [Mycena alexandri]